MKKLQKRLKKTHRIARRKYKLFSKHPFVLPVVTFFVVLFAGLSGFVALQATTVGATDTRIVEVYVDGQSRVVTTRATTVEDLLQRMEIRTLPEDIIEPARTERIQEDGTQINIYRARPVELLDNGRVITILSAQQSPRKLAEEAGLALLPEDTVSLQTREGSVLESAAADTLVIDRSVPVKLTLFGVLTEVRTTADTIAELLEELQVELKEGETIQPADAATPISEGLLLAVNAPGVKTATIIESIPFATEQIQDGTKDKGTTEVQSEGVLGEQAVVYEITEENGVEISRRPLQTVVTRQPVAKVVVVGTKALTLSPSVSVSDDKASLMAAAGIATSDYAYVDYIISKESGWRPGASNSSSGAYGLCQSLPASKMASAGADYLTNPVTQLRWCNGYASRYGGWAGAYNAWIAQKWW